MAKRIGIDLGGTKIEGAVVDEKGYIQKRLRIPTESANGYEHILSNIHKLFLSLTAEIDSISSIGVCTPGFLSTNKKFLKGSNTLCLIGKPIKDDLESLLHHPISLENDANCFAHAEALFGAGKDYSVVFGVIMGTGVGGGIVINGQIHPGRQHIAGEWGHSVIRAGGNSCYCGKQGCIEAYISGPALEKRYEELTGKKVPLKDYEKYQSAQWKEEFLTNFGLALSNIVNILDPDCIVLGGGVSNIKFLYAKGIKYVEQFCFNETLETPIVQNKLGDSSGVIGAAYLPPNS